MSKGIQSCQGRGLDIDWTFKGDPGAGPVHKLPGKGEGNLGQGDGPQKVGWKICLLCTIASNTNRNMSEQKEKIHNDKVFNPKR